MRPGVVGNCRTQTLAEIWRGEPMQRLREDMLNEREHAACGLGDVYKRQGIYFQVNGTRTKHD